MILILFVCGALVFAGRFHANVGTVIFSKPIIQFIQTFCKRIKSNLLIFCMTVGIRDADTGEDPGLVDIRSTAILTNNFKRQ